jgi:hypothetical protein
MKKQLLISQFIDHGNDTLAEDILADSKDPSFSKICSYLPQSNSWDFIGTDQSKWKFLIGNDGRLIVETTFRETNSINYRQEVYCIFDPEKQDLPYANKKGEQNLLSGWLPVNIITFPGQWEQTAFAVTDENAKTFIHIKVSDSKKSFYFKIPEQNCTNPEILMNMEYRVQEHTATGDEFERELTNLQNYWNKVFSETMQIEIPESNLLNGAKNSVIKSFHSCVGNAIHYGVTRYFCDTDRNAESFAPTTTTMTDTCLEWGLFDKAKQVLEYFLDNFVTDTGKLIHRGNGASISEHGMILETIAKYYNYTNDESLISQYSKIITNICKRLLNERKDAKKTPEDSISYGLISGCPEDDVRAWEPAPWFSGNCWVCRGLTEISKVLAKNGFSDLAEDIQKECDSFKEDIAKSMRASLLDDFLPPYAGYDIPFEDMNAEIFYKSDQSKRRIFSSYSNYRFYPEMLSSGIISDELSRKIIDYRSSHGGEFIGLTMFKLGDEQFLDDWPIYHQLRGLLETDRRKKFLMTLYAHMAHHQARNTFFAPESTSIDRLDSIHCVPAQLTVPQALRWMLLYEERDQSTLCLCRAIPGHWLYSENGIKVSNAPTRWGKVSFSLTSQGEEFFIDIKLPAKSSPDEINLYIPNINSIKSSHPGNYLRTTENKLSIIPDGNKRIEIQFSIMDK